MRRSVRRPWPSSPGFAVRAQFHIERPAAAILLCQMPRLLGDGGRLDEEVVGSVLEALARPGDVDHSIYNNVGNMHSLRPKFAGHGFGQDSLRGLGWCEPGEGRLTSQGRSITRHDDVAAAGADHRGREATRQMKQPHRVDLKIAVKHCGVDLEERAEGAAHRVVHEGSWHTEIAFYAVRRRLDLRSIRYVACVSLAVGKLALQLGKPLRVAREHGDAMSARSEATRQSGARPGTDA